MGYAAERAARFLKGPRFLICDGDSKFRYRFKIVMEAAGAKLIKTPYQAPNANAHSERFVRGQMVILTDDPESPERIVRLFAQFGNVNARAPARRPTPRPKGTARPPAKKAGS